MTAAPPRRRSRVATSAVVADGIALVGLVLVAIGASVRGDALALVLLGALLGLAAVPGAVLSGIALGRRARARAVRPARIGVGIALLSACALAVGPGVLALAWTATPNPAVAVLHPYEQEVVALGGTPLCTNGDPGRGPDNTSPWREAYFSVPASAPVLQHLESRAAVDGFALRPSAEKASPFSGTTRYSAGRRGATLSAEIATQGTSLDCDPDYGRTQRAAPGTVLVDLTVSLDPAR